jgi:hypothetical protein
MAAACTGANATPWLRPSTPPSKALLSSSVASSGRSAKGTWEVCERSVGLIGYMCDERVYEYRSSHTRTLTHLAVDLPECPDQARSGVHIVHISTGDTTQQQRLEHVQCLDEVLGHVHLRVRMCAYLYVVCVHMYGVRIFIGCMCVYVHGVLQ